MSCLFILFWLQPNAKYVARMVWLCSYRYTTHAPTKVHSTITVGNTLNSLRLKQRLFALEFAWLALINQYSMQQYQSVAAVTQTQPLHYPTFLYSGVAEGGGERSAPGGTIGCAVGYKPVPVGCFEIKVVLMSGHYSQSKDVCDFEQFKLWHVYLRQWWGTYLVSWAAWIVHYRWRAAKSSNFILKFYLCLTVRKGDFWLVIWVPAYSGVSFWRDVVL